MCATSRSRVQLLLHVARSYYLDGKDQRVVAEEVGCSRPTVSRLLAEARERGIVRFDVSHPLEQVLACERLLRRKFGLSDALVAGETEGPPAHSVGLLAGKAIVERVGERSMVALSNGTSVGAVVQAMPQVSRPLSCVTQMIGALAQVDSHLIDSPGLCRRMAERLGGVHRSMPVPIVLGSAAVAASVRAEEVVLTTLELAARSDIAVCGVGAVGTRNPSILRPFLSPRIEEEIRRAGAVAHICGHHFDASGRHVRTSLCDRTITMQPERLSEIPTSMVVAWGTHKAPALRAVMRTGLVSCLVTDEPTARALLDAAG